MVRLMCDNAVTVAYIKNEGGTGSYTLMQMTIRLFKGWDRKAIDHVGSRPSTRSPQHPGRFPVQSHPDTEHEGTMAMERLRPVFASGASRRSTCLRHSPTEDSSSCITVSGPQGRVHGRHVGALGLREGPPVCFIAIQDGPSSTEENIRTPGSSSWTPCRCPGTTGGASCLLSRHSRWSFKFCTKSLSHQASG